MVNSLSSLSRLERMHHWKEKTSRGGNSNSNSNQEKNKLKVQNSDGVKEMVISDLTNDIALIIT